MAKYKKGASAKFSETVADEDEDYLDKISDLDIEKMPITCSIFSLDGLPLSALNKTILPKTMEFSEETFDIFGFKKERGIDETEDECLFRIQSNVSENESTRRERWITHLEFTNETDDEVLKWGQVDIDTIKNTNFEELIKKDGIPHSLRPFLWMIISGGLKKRKSAIYKYKQVLNQCSKAGSISIDSQIEKDVLRTLPNHLCFLREDSVGVNSLRNLLKAIAFLYPDLGYCQGIGMVVANILLICPEEYTFWIMNSILDDILPSNYYAHSLIGLQTDQRVIQHLVNIHMPELSEALKKHDVDLSMVTANWLLTLFSSLFRPDFLFRIWDLFLTYGSPVLFRVIISMLKINEEEILMLINKDQTVLSIDIFNYLSKIPKRIHNIDHLLEICNSFDYAITPLVVKELREKISITFIGKDGFINQNTLQYINKKSVVSKTMVLKSKTFLQQMFTGTINDEGDSLKSLAEADFEKIAGKQLYLADILTLVKNVNYGGDIYIVTNLGITDKAPSLDNLSQKIKEIALAKKRTGGSFVRIANDQDILDWFSFLKAQYLESYEIIYQESTNTDYINQKKTSTSFLLKANHRYTVWGTLRTKLTKFFPTSIDLFNSQGVSTNLPIDKRIGEEFSISINDLITADDQYSVAFNTDQIESYSFQIRVLEFNATFGYSLSFGDKFEKSPIHGTPAIIYANILEYNPAQITEAPQKITIYDSTYKQVYTNLLTPSCEKNVYSTQDTWQCSNADQVYYIKIDTQEESRTFTITCLQSDNGNPGSGSCLHGGTQLPDNSCMCQVGWFGTNCAQINCMNNATLVGGVCNCKVQYTGQFCEHALETCSNDELLYNTEVTSFIFVIDLQNLDLNDFKTFGNPPNDFPQMSEYILITYDGSNGETSDAEVLKTSNPDIFSKALQNMVPAPINHVGKSNYYEYLEKGLNLQSGSRSVLLWMPNLFDCSTDQTPMASSVINLIQKKNADVRFISKSQYCPSFPNVILAGNGMVTNKYADFSELSSYLENVILLQQGTYLVVTDSNYMTGTSNCSQSQTITFPINGDADYYITLLGYTDASLAFSSQDATQSLIPVLIRYAHVLKAGKE
uniref:RUN and TBC1 domain-containing protein 3 n=1 Tax=Rhabditophanes sp. KR3021 TaxID=114890 RepID=A0AC35U4F2_9BILA